MARICFVWNVQDFNHMDLDHPISMLTEILILVQLVNFLPNCWFMCFMLFYVTCDFCALVLQASKNTGV